VGVPSQLLERRPDIAAAERRVAEANEQIGIARAVYFPTGMLNASVGFEGSTSYRETTLTAFQQVEDNLAALRILDQEAQQQRRAVESAQDALQLFTNRYRGGVDNYLQVITAQTTVLNNQRGEIDILRRRMDAAVLLVKALGGGWDAAALSKATE